MPLTKAEQKELTRLEREQEEDLLWVEKYKEANLLEFFDKPPYPGPNPRQAELLDAFLDLQYRVFTFTGSNRLGKTTILTILGLSLLYGKFLWNNQRLLSLFNHNKPRKVRYIGQDWKAHIESVVVPELEKWWPKSRKLKTRGNGIISKASWTDEKTGSTLEIMSNKQDPGVHEGWSGDLILYDEPPRREIRVANARGLIDRNGREIFAATLLGEPWIDREIIKGVLEDGRPDPAIYNVHGQIHDNVGYGITQDGVDEFAKKLKPEEKKARLLGIPSYMEGLIYPTFSRKLHLKPRFRKGVPSDYIIDISIDTHPRENQAILFVATAPDNRKYIVEEIWDHGDGIWIGQEIVKAVKWHNFTVNRIICDPLAKGDSNNPNTVYDNIEGVLFKYGLSLETASKDLKSGIIKVKEFLMGPNNEPSLFFFDDLVRTIYEIEGYMWDKETQKPIDKDDHMLENLYRILLLDTKWYDAHDYEEKEDDHDRGRGRSRVGGY